jgi:OOP family OmpA-OmpF porin
MASASHPWEAGVKIGIHWRYIKPDKHETEDYFEPITREVHDTNYVQRIDTILIARFDTIIEAQPEAEEDTVVPAEIQKVAEEVEQFNKIYFAFDSYKLTNKAKFYLNSIVEALNRVPDAKITLDGHASSEGQDLYNDILSGNRAKAVKAYLVSRGVDKDRFVTIGHGSRIPNEDKDREEMRRDRRVEVKVVYNDNVIKK